MPGGLKMVRCSFIVGLALLSVQFVLGMIANIYATPMRPSNIGVHYVMGYVLAAVGLIIIITTAPISTTMIIMVVTSFRAMTTIGARPLKGCPLLGVRRYYADGIHVRPCMGTGFGRR